jgi:cytochrome P450
MVLYPDVQRKAREELYKVVGRSRIPNFNDRERLPYIEALLNEVLRWNPVAPLGETCHGNRRINILTIHQHFRIG